MSAVIRVVLLSTMIRFRSRVAAVLSQLLQQRRALGLLRTRLSAFWMPGADGEQECRRRCAAATPSSSSSGYCLRLHSDTPLQKTAWPDVGFRKQMQVKGEDESSQFSSLRPVVVVKFVAPPRP